MAGLSLDKTLFTLCNILAPQRVVRAPSTHVYEADVELLGRVAALQVPPGIDVVVPHDARDDVGRGDALSPLGRCKHA